MSNHDRHFFDTFLMVLGALVAFTVAIYIIANHIGGKTQRMWVLDDAAAMGVIENRLAPAGRVAMSGEEVVVATPEPVAAVAAAPVIGPDTGKQIYDSACFACHAIGAAGAPKLGDIENWAPRIAQGMETLSAHAIEGFQGSVGIMPPKGGRVDLSDEEIVAAVEYMVGESQ